jgi:hypothetical protein
MDRMLTAADLPAQFVFKIQAGDTSIGSQFIRFSLTAFDSNGFTIQLQEDGYLPGGNYTAGSACPVANVTCQGLKYVLWPKGTALVYPITRDVEWGSPQPGLTGIRIYKGMLISAVGPFDQVIRPGDLPAEFSNTLLPSGTWKVSAFDEDGFTVVFEGGPASFSMDASCMIVCATKD